MTTYVGFRRDAVRFVPRDPPFYESSPGVRRRFCPHCGTPLSYEGASYAGELHLHVSGFEHPERFEPTAHVAYSEHLPWLRLADDLPRKD